MSYLSTAVRFVSAGLFGYFIGQKVFPERRGTPGENKLFGRLYYEAKELQETIPGASKIRFVEHSGERNETDGTTVYINPKDADRFTLAHEVGHIINHDNLTIRLYRSVALASLGIARITPLKRIGACAGLLFMNGCLVYSQEKRADFFAIKQLDADELASTIHGYQDSSLGNDFYDRMEAQMPLRIRIPIMLKYGFRYLLDAHPSDGERAEYMKKAYNARRRAEPAHFSLLLSGKLPDRIDEQRISIHQAGAEAIYGQLARSSGADSLFDVKGLQLSFQDEKIVLKFIAKEICKTTLEMTPEKRDKLIKILTSENQEAIEQTVSKYVADMLDKPKTLQMSTRVNTSGDHEEEDRTPEQYLDSLLPGYRELIAKLYGEKYDVEKIRATRQKGVSGPIIPGESIVIEVPERKVYS